MRQCLVFGFNRVHGEAAVKHAEPESFHIVQHAMAMPKLCTGLDHIERNDSSQMTH